MHLALWPYTQHQNLSCIMFLADNLCAHQSVTTLIGPFVGDAVLELRCGDPG